MTSARVGSNDPLEFLGALAITGIMVLLVAWLYLPEFVYWSCFILHILWGMADFGPFHTGPHRAITCWPSPPTMPNTSRTISGST